MSECGKGGVTAWNRGRRRASEAAQATPVLRPRGSYLRGATGGPRVFRRRLGSSRHRCRDHYRICDDRRPRSTLVTRCVTPPSKTQARAKGARTELGLEGWPRPKKTIRLEFKRLGSLRSRRLPHLRRRGRGTRVPRSEVRRTCAWRAPTERRPVARAHRSG